MNTNMKKALLLFLVCYLVVQVHAQVSKTVVCTAGGLSSLLTQQDFNTVTNLSISGTMDARDFETIKMNMSGTLTTLNMSNVTIAAYKGTGGTINADTSYQANSIPSNSITYNSNKITSITLPTSITSLSDNALFGCSM